MFPTYTRVAHHREKRDPTPKKPSRSFWLNQARLTHNYGPRNPLPTKVAFHKPQENPTSQLSTAILCRNIYQLKIRLKWFYLLKHGVIAQLKLKFLLDPRHLFRLYMLDFVPLFTAKEKAQWPPRQRRRRPCNWCSQGSPPGNDLTKGITTGEKRYKDLS